MTFKFMQNPYSANLWPIDVTTGIFNIYLMIIHLKIACLIDKL